MSPPSRKMFMARKLTGAKGDQAGSDGGTKQAKAVVKSGRKCQTAGGVGIVGAAHGKQRVERAIFV